MARQPINIGSSANGNLVIISNRLKNGEVIATESMFSLESEKFIYVDIFNESLENLKLVDAQKLYYRDKENRVHQLITGISRQGSIPIQLLFEIENLEYQPITLDGYPPQRGDYLQFFYYDNEDHMLVASQNGSLDLYTVDFSNYLDYHCCRNFQGYHRFDFGDSGWGFDLPNFHSRIQS